MNKKEFTYILILIIPELIKLLIENKKLDTNNAFNTLYSSKLYSKLEDMETDVWHFSVNTLYSLLNEELETGKITFPEV